MKKFILVYTIDDYCENGGGDQHEIFDSEFELDKRAEEVFINHKIIIAGEIIEVKYKAIEKVTKVVRDDD